MLDDGCCAFATHSFDVILSIYICMFCAICNKLYNDAAIFFKENKVKSQ